MPRPHAVVIGAGLAGLTAALRAAPFGRVTVLERDSRLGGQLWTSGEHGFLVERGGEGFVFRSEAVPALAQEVGLGDALIGQAIFTSYGFGDAGLVALKPGEAGAFLGFQVPAEDLGRGIRSLRAGMGSLVDGLHDALRRAGVVLRTDAEVAHIEPRTAGLTRVRCADGAQLDADAVVLAAPAAPAARILEALLPAADRDALAGAVTTSSVTVELAFERGAIDHALDGTGFVVAAAQQRDGLRACTFTSSKFAGRAPADRVSLRAFFRPDASELGALDDAAWVARAERTFERILPMRGKPLHAWVSRWPHALPVHGPAFASLVARIEPQLAAHAVRLAGSAFHGSGIDAAVRSGDSAGRELATRLTTPHPAPP